MDHTSTIWRRLLVPGKIKLSRVIDDIDECGVVFAEVVAARMRFFSEYDFGDSWRHEVLTESVGPVPLVLTFATCIDRQRASPPEDCGSTNGTIGHEWI